MMTTVDTIFVRLSNGYWGVKTTAKAKEGSRVTVRRRDGTTKDVILGRRVDVDWKGGWAIFELAERDRRRVRGSRGSAAGGGRGKGRIRVANIRDAEVRARIEHYDRQARQQGDEPVIRDGYVDRETYEYARKWVRLERKAATAEPDHGRIGVCDSCGTRTTVYRCDGEWLCGGCM